MIKVYSYRWVPPIVRGVVRDVRVRWALEEIGLPYENVLIGPAEQKSDEYRAIQPFGQVPALVEDDLTLSESGAIVHYLAQKSEKLMPKEPAAQARVTSWMFAALNSVEPFVQQWQFDVFFAKEDGKTAPRSRLLDLVGKRLDALVPKLEGREYLEGRFTAADILMAGVMRMLFDSDHITSRPALLEYRKRCEARPRSRRPSPTTWPRSTTASARLRCPGRASVHQRGRRAASRSSMTCGGSRTFAAVSISTPRRIASSRVATKIAGVGGGLSQKMAVTSPRRIDDGVTCAPPTVAVLASIAVRWIHSPEYLRWLAGAM